MKRNKTTTKKLDYIFVPCDKDRTFFTVNELDPHVQALINRNPGITEEDVFMMLGYEDGPKTSTCSKGTLHNQLGVIVFCEV